MGHEDRERKFEQALERHLHRDAAGERNQADAGADVRDERTATVACPDAQNLAAFHERTLPSEEMNATTEHIASCSRCQEILLQLEATDEIPLQVEGENDLKIREPVLSTGALYEDYAARRTPSLTIEGQPKTAVKGPQEISRGRGFKALRWAAPIGAIAAGLLIWFVVRDNKVQRMNRLDNVQVAQEQPTDQRLPAPQPLPASPAPEPTTKTRQFDGQRKEESKIKQPAEESGAPRAPKRSSSAANANEIADVTSNTSPNANIRQLPTESRNYDSHIGAGDKLPEVSTRPADVSATAAAPAAVADARARAKSAALAGEAAKTRARESGGAVSKIESPNGEERLPTQQAVANEKLQLSPSLKKDVLENAKIIVAPNSTRWRLLTAGRVERSVDSGITWLPQDSGVKVQLLAGSAPNEAVCWIVGHSGTILRTTDGGGHWSKAVSPMAGDVAGVQAVDAMTAEIFDANRSSRFVTHDGGVTWEAVKQ